MINKIKKFFNNHFNLFVFLSLAVIIFSLYGKTLFFDWTYYDDDVLILDKQDYLKFSNIKNIFFDTVFGKEQDRFLRPGLNITFLVEKYLYGTTPTGYHLTNLVIHLLAVFSIFLFLTLKYDKYKTFVLCLLFAVHPAIVQAVAWVPGRNDSLLTLFLILSFYFFIKYFYKNNKIFFLLHLLCFILALLIKETAVIAPIFFICFAIANNMSCHPALDAGSCCSIKNKNSSFLKSSTLPLFLSSITYLYTSLIIVYLLYRKFALSYHLETVAVISLLKNFVNSFPAVIKYISNIFFPINLSVFPSGLENNYLLAFASILVFILFFLISKKYNIKNIIFGFCWFLFFLFPTFLMPDNKFYDHRIYLPLVGILIVLSEFLTDKNLYSKKVFYLIVTVYIIFSCISYVYTDKFKNKEIFWVTAVTCSPNSDIANAVVAGILTDNAIYAEAEQKYLKAIQLNKNSKHYVNLAVLYMKTKKIEQAKQVLLQALSLNDNNPLIYYNLALIYRYEGNLTEAEKMKNLYIDSFNKTDKVSKFKNIEL